MHENRADLILSDHHELYDVVIIPHGRAFTKNTCPVPAGYMHEFYTTAWVGAVKVDIYIIKEQT